MDTEPIMIVAVTVLTPLLLRWVLQGASRQRARVDSGVLRFPAGRLWEWTLYFGAAFFAVMAVFSYVAVDQEGWLWIGFGGFSLFFLLIRPAHIVVDTQGIERYWYGGTFRRRYAWEEVDHAVMLTESVCVDLLGDDVRVIPKHGSKVIRHSPYHVDRERFIFELKKRGIKVHDGRMKKR